MKSKQILAIALLVFAGVSVAYMVVKDKGVSPTPQGEDSAKKMRGDQLIVYYFCGDVRCATCHNLENYTRETLEKYFKKEMTSGQIIWQVINTDRPENRHYVEDYKLVSKAVVLSRVADGQEIEWKKLDEIWQKVGDKDSYLKYVRHGIEEFLEAEK